jgi:hypothetical protein
MMAKTNVAHLDPPGAGLRRSIPEHVNEQRIEGIKNAVLRDRCGQNLPKCPSEFYNIVIQDLSPPAKGRRDDLENGGSALFYTAIARRPAVLSCR